MLHQLDGLSNSVDKGFLPLWVGGQAELYTILQHLHAARLTAAHLPCMCQKAVLLRMRRRVNVSNFQWDKYIYTVHSQNRRTVEMKQKRSVGVWKITLMSATKELKQSSRGLTEHSSIPVEDGDYKRRLFECL